MFLSKLNEEKKELFLDLSIHASMANNIMEEEERKLIGEYCLEMGLSNVTLKSKMNLDETLEKIKSICNEQEIRIITFEILGLLVSDKEYDDLEKVFVKKMKSKLDLTDELIEDALRLLSDFNNVFEKICKKIL